MSSRHQQWSSSSRAGSLAAYALALRRQQQLDPSRAGSLAAGVSDRIVISSRAQPRRVTGSVRSARVVVKSEPRRVTGSVRSSLASQSLSVTCVALVTLPYRLKGSGRLVRELVREFPPHRREWCGYSGALAVPAYRAFGSGAVGTPVPAAPAYVHGYKTRLPRLTPCR